jgi:hypothetical protein
MDWSWVDKMAGRLETSIWNLTLLASASACGPTIPIDDDGEGSFDEDGSESVDEGEDEGPTTDPPCVDGDCPECQSDADCDGIEYCSPSGQCVYYYCGVAGGDDVFRCSPPYYECYSDDECADGQECLNYSCVDVGCDVEGAFDGEYSIPQPSAGIVDVAFVDLDAVAPQELAIATSTEVLVAGIGSGALASVATAEDIGSIAAADVDLDGDLDLVVADRGQGGQLLVLANDGTGGFTPSAPIASPGIALELELGDPENDGLADAFVRTETGIVRHVDLGPPTTLVSTPVTAMALVGWSLAYTTDAQAWWLPVATLVPAAPTLLDDRLVHGFARATLDPDADPDLIGVVVQDVGTEVRTWHGPVATPDFGYAIDGGYARVVAADVDGDGLDDAVLSGDGQLVLLHASPLDGHYFGCRAVADPSHEVALMAAGDWDGDAEQELAISDGTQISILDRYGKGE